MYAQDEMHAGVRKLVSIKTKNGFVTIKYYLEGLLDQVGMREMRNREQIFVYVFLYAVVIHEHEFYRKKKAKKNQMLLESLQYVDGTHFSFHCFINKSVNYLFAWNGLNSCNACELRFFFIKKKFLIRVWCHVTCVQNGSTVFVYSKLWFFRLKNENKKITLIDFWTEKCAHKFLDVPHSHASNARRVFFLKKNFPCTLTVSPMTPNVIRCTFWFSEWSSNQKIRTIHFMNEIDDHRQVSCMQCVWKIFFQKKTSCTFVASPTSLASFIVHFNLSIENKNRKLQFLISWMKTTIIAKSHACNT